jgi:serine/threonine protein kinase
MKPSIPSAALATTTSAPGADVALARTLATPREPVDALAALRSRVAPSNTALLRCSQASLEWRMFGRSSAYVSIAGREFAVLRRLGAGGMGVVYEVEQRGREGRMALKLLHQAGSEEGFRLKREFRVLSELSHPNLVTLYELLGDGEGCAFTMELVPGADFLAHTRPDGVLDLPRLRAALRGLAEGLDALHASGVVHRDLKPSNVLVTPEGRVVLLDFGVALDGAERDVAGTLAFMPDEQRCGATVPASDLHAVGTMLSLALTGTFEPAGDASSELEPWLALSRELRSPRPEQRPTARELLAFLDGQAAPARAQPTARKFVGRVRELEVLRRHATTASGEASLLVVEGASGLGKSWLLAELTRELERRSDVLLVAGRCSRREAVRYRALDPLLDALSSVWKALGDAGEAIVPRGAGALIELFPVLARVPVLASHAHDASPIADARERRRVAVSALRDVLHELARTRRVVLCLDDAHWMDDDSRELLADLVRAPFAPPLLVLALTRPAESAAPLPLEPLTRQLPSERVVLEPLDREAALSLVQVLLPERPALWERALALGEGSPFLLGQVGALAGDTGALGEALGLEPILKARLDKLGPVPRRVLELVTVAGQPVPPELLREVLGESDVSLLGALTMLEAQRYLRSRRGEEHAFEPYHDRVTDFVHRIVEPEHKRGYHIALGRALEAEDPARHARSLLFHFRAAGDATRALRHGRLAAEAAAARLAFHEAADIYATCVELSDDRALVRELKRRRAEVLASAGRDGDAAAVWEELARHADSEAERDELTRRSAELLLRGGRYDEGMQRLAPLLARLDLQLPSSGLAGGLQVLWQRLRLAVRGLGYRLRESRDIDPRQLARLDVCLTIARYIGARRIMLGIDYGTRALRYALDCGDRRRLIMALLVESVLRSARRSPRAAQVCLAEARKLSEEVGDEEQLAHVYFASAQCALVHVDNARVLSDTEEAVRRLTERCTGVASDLAMVRYMRLIGRHTHGETAQLDRELAEGLRDALERDDARARGSFQDLGATVRLCQGDVEGALRELREARSTSTSTSEDYDMAKFGEVLFLSQVDLYEGRPAAARARIEANLGKIRRAGLMHVPVTRMLTVFMLGLALLPFRDRAARRKLRWAVATLERESPTGRAWGQSLAGGVALREGKRVEAARLLDASADELARLGCMWQSTSARVAAAQARGDHAAVEQVASRLSARGVGEPLKFLTAYGPLGALESV